MVQLARLNKAVEGDIVKFQFLTGTVQQLNLSEVLFSLYSFFFVFQRFSFEKSLCLSQEFLSLQVPLKWLGMNQHFIAILPSSIVSISKNWHGGYLFMAISL